MNTHGNDKSLNPGVLLKGKFQAISANPGARYSRAVLAAGAVLWLDGKIAVVHRPRYNDWSLPKGKVDRGENLVAAAVREIFEETGYVVRLEKLLGVVNYPVNKNTKVVYYWNAQVTGGAYSPGDTDDEVDELRWLDPETALDLVSYAVDRKLIKRAIKHHTQQVHTRVLLVRHGDAGDRQQWAGNDLKRPLTVRGLQQAKALRTLLRAYQPTTYYAADPLRCKQTLKKLASKQNLPISIDPLFGDAAWQRHPKKVLAKFQEVISAGGVTAIASQGEVIPGIINALAQEASLPLQLIPAAKASVWVLSFNSAGKLVGADYLESPLRVR
ncbi:NUDIX hydrolase [Corynebacterium caspium]|uniref:NUDIX hydrolase n=1 Tax=Corynebacterium caspium TaxID=234828 RepID=UPI00035FE53F|nr:NUDIX hydrolase [Corynebacterium caspium]WKD59401.1 Diadenosine hexaphosphate hydrolase [Corynebacterium caspium DSM 44850]